jgi:uncharacterized protein with PIN domain
MGYVLMFDVKAEKNRQKPSLPICPYCKSEISTVTRETLGVVIAFACPKCNKILSVSPTDSMVR